MLKTAYQIAGGNYDQSNCRNDDFELFRVVFFDISAIENLWVDRALAVTI